MEDARSSGEPVLLARILRYCPFCAEETPHEVRRALDAPLLICASCRERSLLDELDRD